MSVVTSVLLAERTRHVLIVTLNRPERLNALNGELLDALRDLWRETRKDASVRCVVVTGAGKGFCAGADVELLATRRTGVGDTAREELSFLPGVSLDVPVIVAVNGACAGGGLHFVADADIALAGDRASFLDPHVSVGHVSALEPLTLFFRARRDVLARLALLGAGEQLGAEEARDAGLVSEVVPAERLLARSVELAERVAANSPTAVRRTRRVLREFQEHLLGDALDTGWRTIRDHWEHPDAHEGPAAFHERREPRWVEP